MCDSQAQQLVHPARPALVKQVPDIKAIGSCGEMEKRGFYEIVIVDGDVGEPVPQVKKLGLGEVRGWGVTIRYPLWRCCEGHAERQLMTFPYFPLTAQSWPLCSTRNQPLGKVKPW